MDGRLLIRREIDVNSWLQGYWVTRLTYGLNSDQSQRHAGAADIGETGPG